MERLEQSPGAAKTGSCPKKSSPQWSGGASVTGDSAIVAAMSQAVDDLADQLVLRLESDRRTVGLKASGKSVSAVSSLI